MDIPSCTANAPSYPSPTRMPVNGFNGSLHDVFFYAPSYHVNPYTGDGFSTLITWKLIDAYANAVSVWSIVLGVCLGMMLMTLLYVLFITPAAKRWKPFHSTLLAALLLKTIYLVVVCTQTTSLTYGLNPAYAILTMDFQFRYSTTFLAWRLSGLGLDLLATIFALACLFIQAKTTLAGLHLSRRLLYLSLLTYLLIASLACIITRILSFAVQTQILLAYPRPTTTTSLDPAAISLASSALTAIVLGSYCLIALLTIIHVLWTRRALLGWGRLRHYYGGGGNHNTRYDRALSLLALILLESLIAPLVLAIMIPLPDPDAGYARPEILLLPVVLALLPFGGLFSGREGEDGAANKRKQGRIQQIQEVAGAAHAGRDNVVGHADANAGPWTGAVHVPEPGLVHLAELSAGDSGSWKDLQTRVPTVPPSAVDRELAALDAL